MLSHMHAVEQEPDQVQVLQRGGLPRFELRLRPRHETPTHGTLTRAATRDGLAERLQAARILAGRHADEHLLDDTAIQRIGLRHRLKRRQRDFAGRGAHAGARHRHLPAAEDDFAPDGPRAARGSIGLMRVPRATDGRAVLIEHRGKHAQARAHREFKQLRPGVDEQVDQRQMTHGGIVLGNRTGYARLRFHGGSFSVRLTPRVWSPLVYHEQ